MAERAFWNPMANMGAIRERATVTIVRGEGATVWDDEGNAYLDAIASLWYCNVGHGRQELADAGAKQLRQLESYQTYERYTSPAAEELARRVAALSPLDGAKVFFTAGGGGDAVDTAAKLARAYWDAVGKPGKHVIVSRQFAYHGSNAYGTALGGMAALVEPYGRLVPDVEQVPWNDADALAETIDRVGADRVAAFIAEPVVGAGGVLLPPDGYLEAVQRICQEREVLFIADEVITGFGRIGEWFGSQRLGIQPDLMTCAKGITSGYVPLGAVIASARVAEPFWTAGTEHVFRHGYTYSGHTTACAVALANIDLLERERLVERVRDLETVLEGALRPLESHPLVAEVRAGLGLLGAVELSDSAKVPQVVDEARARGVLLRALRGVALQISPPFTITEDEIGTLARVIGESLDAAG
ncbi:MAG TPA: aminotransferase class III-fold pyridoxal phosphate-dependent enzyme [Gaiellaceae bacterium]|nr:aminotransferase class III-fold pyridoxal phosphate-dependent enzyme [Gaiellaceae bacterium]